MSRPESPAIAASDDIAAALDAIRESVAIIATRRRAHLNQDDLRELAAILAATDRIGVYALAVRNAVSAANQKREKVEAERVIPFRKAE